MTTLVMPRTTIPQHVVADRGSWGMLMFIVTETMLFVSLFFSYYYLGRLQPVWPPSAPKYGLALLMLVLLLSSSLVLYRGERAERRGHAGVARRWTGLTVAIGLVFLGIQALEYRDRLRVLKPTTDAYGSIFYTITSFHAAHVILGLLMLGYVLLLPEIGPASKPPHRPLFNASLYWHFVDAVWIVIVALLYLAPNVGR
jgi:heme/copper-type cytochrome/quinol oxidase subunit 3